MIKMISQQTSVHPRTAVGSVRLLGLLSKHPMMIVNYKTLMMLFIVFVSQL